MNSDLRHALRQLTKSRGLAATAILTLAVGIGATAAMFSALRALVVHPFDYPQPDRIVQVWSGDRWPLSPADYLDLKDQSTSYESFGVYQPGTVNVGRTAAQAVAGVRATEGVLPAYGVAPQVGRLFTAEDCRPGAAPVALIGYRLWQQTFGGDPGLLGRTIRLDGVDVTVIGIMPGGFEFAAPWMRTEDCQVWLPYQFGPVAHQNRGSHFLCGVARLRPGVSVQVADAEIKSLGRQLSKLYPDSNTNKQFLVRSLHFEMTREIGQKIWLLFGAGTLILLVACANVASMLLARGARRQGEFGLRVALGATRGDLIRLALMESLLLALCGTALGLLLASGGIEALRAITPASPARKAAIALDLGTLLFTGGGALLTALLAGIPPALAAARTSVLGAIKSDTRGAVGSRSRQVMLRGLIVAQIAVAFLLANGAVLFSASYFKILKQNQVLSSDQVLSAALTLRGTAYRENEDRVRFWQKLTERLQILPGVTAVGLTSKLPLEGGTNIDALVNDEVYDPAKRRLNVERSSVTPGYFETMGLALLRGRNLTPADDMSKGGHLSVVVNRAFVEKAWPDKDPIGQVFRANQPKDPWYTATVVGVVENVRQRGVTAEVQAEMYTTPPGHWGDTVYINLRASQSATALASLLRQVVAELDPELPLEHVRTLHQVVQEATTGERAVAGMIDFFMAAALGLVAVGLYGTLSYHIVQRTREIGVRLALGAVGPDILRLVCGQGLRWVFAGILLGLAGSLALSQVMKSLVYGMEGIGLTPLLLSAAVVSLAASVAVLLPAWRAARMDPLVALHTD